MYRSVAPPDFQWLWAVYKWLKPFKIRKQHKMNTKKDGKDNKPRWEERKR